MKSLPPTLRTSLLSADPRRQLQVSQALLGLVVYLVFAVIQHLEVRAGMIDASASWQLTTWTLTGGLAGYATMRWNWHRGVLSPRSVMLLQLLWAEVAVSWSYAITGPARGAVMLILMLLILYGMFALTALQSRALAATGFAMLSAVMLYKSVTEPARYDPRVEVMHFVFAGIVMAAVAVLAERIGRLRARVESQRNDLKRALERNEAMANRDELTGVMNRRAVLERMRGEFALRRRPDLPMALAVIDLDHFKCVNDTLGHAAGDAVLRHFADQVVAAVRAGDMLARWGGEEFLLVFPNTALEHALASLARVRARVRAAPSPDGAPGVAVTFSAGVAACAGQDDLEAAIARADAAMYAAKAQGRDRALAGKGRPPAPPPAVVPPVDADVA